MFFGSLFGSSHQWWPLFLYYIIWPVSAFYERISSVLLDWLVSDPKTAPGWVWTVIDYVAGAFYIIVGTIWIWFIGRLVSMIATRMLPIRAETRIA